MDEDDEDEADDVARWCQNAAPSETPECKMVAPVEASTEDGVDAVVDDAVVDGVVDAVDDAKAVRVRPLPPASVAATVATVVVAATVGALFWRCAACCCLESSRDGVVTRRTRAVEIPRARACVHERARVPDPRRRTRHSQRSA